MGGDPLTQAAPAQATLDACRQPACSGTWWGAAADPERFAARALEVFRAELEAVKARRIRVVGRSLAFRGGIFRFVTNWNLLGPIGRGRIDVETAPGEVIVRWRISFLQMVVVVTTMLVVLGAFAAREMPLPFLLGGLPLLCLWLAGMNVVISIARFSHFVNRCMLMALAASGGHT